MAASKGMRLFGEILIVVGLTWPTMVAASFLAHLSRGYIIASEFDMFVTTSVLGSGIGVAVLASGILIRKRYLSSSESDGKGPSR